MTDAVQKATTRLKAQDEQISSLQEENRVQRTEIEALIRELETQNNNREDSTGFRDRLEEQEKEIAQL